MIVGILLFLGATLLSWCLYQQHKADEFHRGLENDMAVVERLHQLRRLENAVKEERERGYTF